MGTGELSGNPVLGLTSRWIGRCFFLTPQSAYERWSSVRLVASNREADMEPQGIYTRSNPNCSFTLNGVPCVFSTEEM